MQDRLVSIAYPTNPQSSLLYLYENSDLPFSLTGITDQDGQRFETWGYDSVGRTVNNYAGTSTLSANRTDVAYDDATGTRTVKNSFGVADTYLFGTFQGVSKLSEIDRAATATTAAAKRVFTYDSNGYLASQTDWNGNLTTFTNDSHGQPTTITEAAGMTQKRATAITYLSNFHLPSEIVRPGLTVDMTYDGSGNLLTRTAKDTTITTVPYATKGLTRTATYTYGSFGLPATVKSPRTDVNGVTAYSYSAQGELTQETNALGQSVKITQNTPGGRPQTIVDANGVTTTLVYDARQRLTSRAVKTAAGTLTTTFNYDAAGNLTSTVLPDGSTLTNAYDTAHRLTTVTDSLGNYTSYTLDSLGDRTQTNVYTKAGTLTWTGSRKFDALGRELVHTAGAGQTTTETYDANGNVLTVADGLSQTTTNTYDALNRLSSSTDANKGVTIPAYDTNDRIVSITDANGNATSYTRDGFGEAIQQVSPDSGTTVFHYDNDGNLTSKTDALGVITNQTFDALDRPLTTTYPAHTAENVTYTYDQTATGFAFGVGRLTGVSDAAGTLTRAYDERGNLTTEKRVNGTATLTTGYTYDGASRVASMTYPDGTLVGYQHNAAGYVSVVTAKLPGASSTATIATLTHQPFGPVSAAAYGNGVAETWVFDQAYRPTGITDALSGANLQSLTYGYDAANNVKTITDAVNAANSQTLGYDVVNRLTSAVSGTGGYGTQGWTYDKVGNRTTQTEGTSTTTYGYTPGTNRLLTITGSGHALVNPFKLPVRSNETPAYYFANAPPAVPPVMGTSIPSAGAPAVGVSAMLGWPMLLLSFGGVFAFRRRLLKERVVGVSLLFCLLIGITTLAMGCGSSGPGTPGTTTPSQSATATPVFSPAAGTYTSAQTVSITDTTAGANIYYTTDATTPTTSSTQYANSFTVGSSQTVKAIAVASGFSNSAAASAAYAINLAQTATPVFSPAGGVFTSTPLVTITDTTPNATIYYTVDGSTPTTASAKYIGPFGPGGSPQTFSAIAVASGYANSAVATATYTIATPAATPTFSPAAGSFNSVQNVTISDTTPNAAIYYTTDGTVPTVSSTKYTAPISVTRTETIQAIATASGYTVSAASTATYTINFTANVVTNAAGNITGVPSADGIYYLNFTYNNANRPASVSGGAVAASFIYDWTGQRFSKTNGGMPPTIYSYSQDGAVIAENNGGTVTDYIYADGRPIAVIQPTATPAVNQIGYVMADRLGTPQRVTNASGGMIWSTSYQPFGTTGMVTANVAQNLRFPGQLADQETGFSYNLNRDYMPNVGRYLETDPIGLLAGTNTYSYAAMNPHSHIDTSGLQAFNMGGMDFGGINASAFPYQLPYVPPTQQRVSQFILHASTSIGIAGALSGDPLVIGVGALVQFGGILVSPNRLQAIRDAGIEDLGMVAPLGEVVGPVAADILGDIMDELDERAESQAKDQGKSQQAIDQSICPLSGASPSTPTIILQPHQ